MVNPESAPSPPPSEAPSAITISANDAPARALSKPAVLKAPPTIEAMGRYLVLRVLGQGGMGCVYEAYDPDLDRRLALKVIRADSDKEYQPTQIAEVHARLIREAKSLAKLAHPNVVPIFDVGVFEGTSVFLAMEYIKGSTLDRWIATRKPTWHVALDLVLQAGDGLAAAQNAGLLHRDIKPANILVGDDGIVRVLDFGLAKDHEESTREGKARPAHQTTFERNRSEPSAFNPNSDITQLGALMGTPAYLAPEILAGAEHDERSDLFAFGCVAYESLTERRAFSITSRSERLAAIRNGQLYWPHSVPKWVQKLISRALHFNPDVRGGDIRTFVAMIRAGQRRARIARRFASLFLGLSVSVATILAWHDDAANQGLIDPECGDPGRFLESVLNTTALDRASASFRASGLDSADTLWSQAHAGLLAWRESWIDSRRSLCPTYRTSIQEQLLTAGEREQARGCFDESKNEVATLLDIWSHASTQQVMDAGAGIASLSDPRMCTAVDSLRQRTPLPSDPNERVAVIEGTRRLTGIEIRIQAGDFAVAEEELMELETANAVSTNVGLHARIAYARGILTYEKELQNATSSHDLWLGALWALAADLPEKQSQLAQKLWFSRVYRSHLVQESESLLGMQRASMKRAGAQPHLVANYERSVAIDEAMKGNLVGTKIHFLRGIRALEGNREANLPILTKLLENLALTYSMLGEPQRALEQVQIAFVISKKLFPPGHPALMASYGKLGHHLRIAGNFYGSFETLSEGASACLQANVPPAMCMDGLWRLPDREVAFGYYSRAAQTAHRVIELELGAGRRGDPIGPWTYSTIAQIATLRGDTDGAKEATARSFQLLAGETSAPPEVFVSTCLFAADSALGRFDLEAADHYLAKALDALQGPLSESAELEFSLHISLARLALRRNQPELALRESETSIRLATKANSPPETLSGPLLIYAESLLAYGELSLARDYAHASLELHEKLDGALQLRSIDHHETLARISLAEQKYSEALRELEICYRAFDSTEALDNRLAPLHFIEAKARWGIDASSPESRASARRVAKTALNEYLDWHSGARPMIRDVRAWLASHR
jgi:serine/threonine protein kinase